MKNDTCEIYIEDGELVVEIKRGKHTLRTHRVSDLRIRNSYWRNTKMVIE